MYLAQKLRGNESTDDYSLKLCYARSPIQEQIENVIELFNRRSACA